LEETITSKTKQAAPRINIRARAFSKKKEAFIDPCSKWDIDVSRSREMQDFDCS
jgi:hypothetical protein